MDFIVVVDSFIVVRLIGINPFNFMLPPVIQANFSGGMNLIMESFNIAANEYGLAYNVRNRRTTLDPILGPVEDTALPSGKKQGIYAFDVYLLAFVGGRGYYKNIVLGTDWTQIPDLALDPYVDYIYLQAVPASQLNYARKLASVDQVKGTNLDTGMLITSVAINGTPAGAIVQDGINQPWIIFSDGSARQIQRYDEWDTTNREYVPVMKQMAYSQGILFGLSPDGKIIYRSVTGRPLDFVVSVTIDGEKGGDAAATSYAVGFDQLNCILPLPSGELLVASANKLSLLTLDYTNTIFAEPTFINNKQQAAGVVNQFSFLNILNEDGYNDSFFIDFDGLRSFNAVNVGDQTEGRNSAFTLNLSDALVVKQSTACAINFNKYSFFSVQTNFAAKNLVAIYDNQTHLWVCFDDYGLGSIKQFAVANQGTDPFLYAITNDDKIYKLFAAPTTLAPSVNLAARTTGLASMQIRLDNLQLVFIKGTTSGIVSAMEYVNGYLNATVNDRLKGLLTENLKLNFSHKSKQTWQVQPNVSWTNDAKLALVEVQLEEQTQETNLQQTAKRYATP